MVPDEGWNFCQGRGLLTNRRTPIPEDQDDFYGQGRLDLVPCSHLVCGACGEVVRSIDGRTVPPQSAVGPIYGVESLRRTDLLHDTDLPVRAYLCRCTAANVVMDTLVKSLVEDDEGPAMPWSCAGHPTVRGRLVLDGVVIDEAADIEAIVFEALDGRPPGGPDRPWATHGAIWVLRLFGRLQGTPLAERVGESVSRAARSDSVAARSEAMTFYLQNPFGPGSAEVVAALRERPELFAGVRSPDAAPGESLEFQLLRILGMRLELDRDAGRAIEGAALPLLRAASWRADLAGATLPTLSVVDLPWVLRERLAIARASKDNAMAVAIWVGIHAPEREAETHALLLAEGLLDEDDL